MKRFLMILAALLLVAPLAARALSQPPPAERIQDFIRTAHVEAGVNFRNLTIFPVISKTARPLSVLSLDEALRNGLLVVTEIGEGRVNELYVENLSKQPVFIMAGEILVGAKQNRVTQNDVLVPPGSKMDVAAFCVEHGRWSYQTASPDGKKFGGGGGLSNPSVRAAAQTTKSQSEVWSTVQSTNDKLSVKSATGSLDEAYKDPQVKTSVDSYLSHFAALPEQYPSMQGAIVMIGHRILVADGFGDHHLLAGLWDKLIRSYALEAIQGESGNAEGSRQAARDFLNLALDADYSEQSTPGLGSLLEISGHHVSGATIVYHNAPVHLALFPRLLPPPVPMEKNAPGIQRSYPR